MVLFDTNAILRYILQDHEEMADRVEKRLTEELCHIPVEVVAEVVYVLSGVYRVERKTIARTLNDLAETDNIRMAEKNVIHHALDIFASSKLDFVDCLMVGYAKEKHYTVFTFDKKLQKQLEKIR
jgi:predicted nucleic-acid-binding protein